MTFPPVRHGAAVPTPAAGCRVSGQLFASTVLGALPSDKVIWNVPLQPGLAEEQGVNHVWYPIGPSANAAGAMVPAPVSVVPRTTAAVEGDPSAARPRASTGTLLNPSAVRSCVGRRTSKSGPPSASGRHCPSESCVPLPQTSSGTQAAFSTWAPAPH